MGLFTTFYEAPTPNQVWVTNSLGKRVIQINKHHEESWVELFIDLIYVGLFITLSVSFKDCSGLEGISAGLLVSIATMILIMFTFRISIDSYSNRFLSDDFAGRILYLAYGYGLAFIVLNTDGSSETECYTLGRLILLCCECCYCTDVAVGCLCFILGMNTDGFLIGYMMCRIINLLMYTNAMIAYPEVIPQYAYGFAVKFFFFVFSLCMCGFYDGRNIFLLVSCVSEFLLLVPIQNFANLFVVTKILRYPTDADIGLIPLNMTIAQQRLCMWSMMVGSHPFIVYPRCSIARFILFD
jgi:hypothetical protein